MKKGNKAFILTGVILAMFLSSLDQTIVATAMPRVVQDLNGIAHLSWVFTAYMLLLQLLFLYTGSFLIFLAAGGLYLLAIIIFLAGSALCGLLQTMNQLILFRALQGIGGDAMMINSFAIIGDEEEFFQADDEREARQMEKSFVKNSKD
jgi:MFS family permease